MIAAGALAPDFEAPDHAGQPFRLSSLKGAPVVLYFYPKAATSGCTIEAKGFRDVYGRYQEKGVRVVGVSTDDCPAQQAFRDAHGLPFPLIADSAHAVAKAYGVLGPTGRARRVTFLIGGDGRVLEVVDSSSVDEHLKRASARFLKA